MIALTEEEQQDLINFHFQWVEAQILEQEMATALERRRFEVLRTHGALGGTFNNDYSAIVTPVTDTNGASSPGIPAPEVPALAPRRVGQTGKAKGIRSGTDSGDS